MPSRWLATAAREGRSEAEAWCVRKRGSRFWAAVVIDAIRDPDGALIGFAKVTRDITERGRAQDELRASERQLRLLIDGVTDYALYMLDRNGIVGRSRAHQRIPGKRDHRPAFLAVLHGWRQGCRITGPCPANRGGRWAIRSRRLARTQGRHPVLGQRDHRSDPE